MGNIASAGAEVTRRCELAWAAGFFDGEGWANATGPRRRRTKQPHAQINQSSADGVPEVLLRFQRAVGVGRVRGPALEARRLPRYRWVASSRGDVARTYAVLAPWLGEVKRAEFQQALSLQKLAPAAEITQAESYTWAAGLFDGEGCTSLGDHGSHAGYHAIEMGLTQASTGGVPEVLVRFASVLGRGRIYGPYRGTKKHEVYRWKTFGIDSIESVLHILCPWLGSVKRRQALGALDVMCGEPRLARGRPEWGSHKTQCVHGHQYAVARIRPYRARSQDGQQRRESQQCLLCAREQAKARRAAKKRES